MKKARKTTFGVLMTFLFVVLSVYPIGLVDAQFFQESTNYIPLVVRQSIYDAEIDTFVQSVDISKLYSYTNYLVTDFSPRNHEFFRTYIDRDCTLGSTKYSKNNLIRTLEALKNLFIQMGYSVVLELVPDAYGGGYNIVVKNPAVDGSDNHRIIDIGAHIDAWKSWDSYTSTPGASDNAVSVAGLLVMAELLRDYPNNHPWQFVVFVSEERGRYGSKIHVNNLSAQYFKTALILDGIGWSEIAPEKMNCIWAFDDIPETVTLAETFNLIAINYSIPIYWRRCSATLQTSDHKSYYEKNLPAVLSIGGLPYGGVNYHSCGDNMENLDLLNAFYTIQQNVAVLLTIDKEP